MEIGCSWGVEFGRETATMLVTGKLLLYSKKGTSKLCLRMSPQSCLAEQSIPEREL